MGLSETEIDLLIKKLREKYREHANRFNPKWFNLEAFEDRLQMALRNRMNLEGFILSEVRNFESIKDKYNKKKDEKAFTQRVDRIIEDNIARIKKYKEIKFHSLAGMEISHFYGALSEFALYYFPILWIVVRDAELRNTLHRHEEELSCLSIPRRHRHPKRIEDHILVLSRKERLDIDIERDKNDYLKSSAFLLHEIIDFTEDLIEIRDPEWDNPLRFDRLYIEGERKKVIINIFTGLTGCGAILKVGEAASQIIKDFRLDAFRRKSFM